MSPPILPANIAWLHALITLAVVLPFITKHALRLTEGNGDPVVIVPEVDTDRLKVLLHPLVLAEVEAVEQADAEVEDPEEEEIPQDSLVDAAFPEEKQSEEGLTSVALVEIRHRHPQQQ